MADLSLGRWRQSYLVLGRPRKKIRHLPRSDGLAEGCVGDAQTVRCGEQGLAGTLSVKAGLLVITRPLFFASTGEWKQNFYPPMSN
jgi:hypothetical protein